MSNAHPSAEEMRAVLKDRDHQIREQWIKVYEARLVREEITKCHRAEGVNHYQACHELVQHYLDLLKDAKVKGWRQIDTE